MSVSVNRTTSPIKNIELRSHTFLDRFIDVAPAGHYFGWPEDGRPDEIGFVQKSDRDNPRQGHTVVTVPLEDVRAFVQALLTLVRQMEAEAPTANGSTRH